MCPTHFQASLTPPPTHQHPSTHTHYTTPHHSTPTTPWHCRRYELQEPLQELRRDLMQCLGQEQQVAAALTDAAVAARKTGGAGWLWLFVCLLLSQMQRRSQLAEGRHGAGPFEARASFHSNAMVPGGCTHHQLSPALCLEDRQEMAEPA